MTEEAIVTRHADKRIRERVGVGKKNTKALADKALKIGLKHGELTGPLRRFVDSVFFKSRTASNFRVLHDKVYIFKGTILITVINLPTKLVKISTKLFKKRQ